MMLLAGVGRIQAIFAIFVAILPLDKITGGLVVSAKNIARQDGQD